MKWFPDIPFDQLPEPVREEYNGLLELIHKHGMPKLGRWVYCKYCYKKVLPKLAFIEGVVQCSVCKAALAPLKEIVQAGSYRRWEEALKTTYRLMNKD
jgi:hypothetical protein